MVGKRLRQLRLEEEKSIAEVSKAIGIGKSSLSDYERGITLPGDVVLKKLASYYGVAVECLSDTEETGMEKTGEERVKLCPFKVKDVRTKDGEDISRWFMPCMKERCMAYQKDGSCRIFAV